MTSCKCVLSFVATGFLLGISSCWGQTIGFDVPGLAEGREVSDMEFQALHPSEKLVNFSVELAADFGFDASDDVAAILLKLHTTQPDVTIVDFCPRNVVDSEIAGVIAVETTDESNSALGIQANTGAGLPWQAATNASIGGKNGQTVRFERKPERQLQVSSGLADRGTGLFIKLYRTSQQPLEGTHPIRLTLRMPSQWRTGFLRMECEAVLRKDSLFDETSFRSTGKRSFLIPVFIEGDETARVQARAIRDAEGSLLAATTASIKRAKPNNFLAEVTRWTQLDQTPRVSPEWLERVTNSVSAKPAGQDAKLPREISIALNAYSRQKQTFLGLGQNRPAESVVMQSQQWSSKRSK